MITGKSSLEKMTLKGGANKFPPILNITWATLFLLLLQTRGKHSRMTGKWKAKCCYWDPCLSSASRVMLRLAPLMAPKMVTAVLKLTGPHVRPMRKRDWVSVFLVKIWRLTLVRIHMPIPDPITESGKVEWAGGYPSQPHTCEWGRVALKGNVESRERDEAMPDSPDFGCLTVTHSFHTHRLHSLPKGDSMKSHPVTKARSKSNISYQCANHVKWLFMVQWSVGK